MRDKQKQRAYNARYYTEHHDQLKVERAKYYANHHKEILAECARYRAEHPEQIKEAKARWCAEHAEQERDRKAQHYVAHRIEIRAHQEKLRVENADREENASARWAKWAKKHPEQMKANSARWWDKHPEQRCAYERRRRARKAGAPINDLTVGQWLELRAAYRNRCFYCQKEYKRLAQDHKIPLSRGGSHTLDNIVPACQSCNSEKGTKTVQEYFDAVTGGW